MPVLTAVGHGSLCAAFPVLLRILGVSKFFHGLAVTATNPKVAPLWASALNFCRTSDHLAAYALAIYSQVMVTRFFIDGTYGLIFSIGGGGIVLNVFSVLAKLCLVPCLVCAAFL